MEFIFIGSSSLALFFSILIFSKREKSLSERLFATWLLVMAIHLVFPYLIYRYYPRTIQLGGWDSGFFVLQGILFQAYVRSFSSQGLNAKRHLYLPLLSIIPVYLLLIPFFSLSAVEKELLYSGESKLSMLYNLLYLSVFAIFVFWSSQGFLVLRDIRKKNRDLFSNLEDKELKWLSFLGITLLSLYGFSFLVLPFLYWLSIAPFFLDYGLYLTMGLYVFLLIFLGSKGGSISTINQDPIYNNHEKEVLPKDYQAAKELDEIMAARKPYMDGELSLYQLSQISQLKPNHISFLLNQIKGICFYDYINQYRTEEVKRKIHLGEHKDFTLLSIAEECGFNSKASFNRHFKKHTGKSPSEYIRSFVGN